MHSTTKNAVQLSFQQIPCRHPAERTLLLCLAVLFGGSSQRVLHSQCSFPSPPLIQEKQNLFSVETSTPG